MAFTVIRVAPGLPPDARRRAHSSGPVAVATRSDYCRLLTTAGFVDIGEVDVTEAFLDTSARWLSEAEAHADELARLEPPGAFAQRQRDRRAQLEVAASGLLRRTLYSTRRAGPSS
jgi:hypothetical protein